MRLSTAALALGLATFSVLSSACYTYKVTEQPLPGAAVRAVLTTEGAVRQSEYLGRTTRSLSGNFVSSGDQTIDLDVITAASRGTFNNVVLRDTLSIPSAQIVLLEERTISWVRTGIVGAALSAAAYAAISGLSSGGEPIPPGPGEPTADRITIPIFRIGR